MLVRAALHARKWNESSIVERIVRYIMASHDTDLKCTISFTWELNLTFSKLMTVQCFSTR